MASSGVETAITCSKDFATAAAVPPLAGKARTGRPILRASATSERAPVAPPRETLRQLGIRLGGGVAAGAAAGAGIDLLVGGLALGAATALGALAGGAWQTVGHYGGRLLGKLKGSRELTVDDAILRLVALRQHQLLGALEGRGHAALAPIELKGEAAVGDDVFDEVAEAWRDGPLPYALERARAHPEWAPGGGGMARDRGGEGEGDDARETALAELAERLR